MTLDQAETAANYIDAARLSIWDAADTERSPSVRLANLGSAENHLRFVLGAIANSRLELAAAEEKEGQ